MNTLAFDFGALDERAILRMLHVDGCTYEQVAEHFGTSRGTVWKIAKRYGALKNQELRDQRTRQQQERDKQDFLAQAIDDIITADVRDFLRELPDSCLDAVITSIPYNVGKAYGGDSATDALRFQTYRGRIIEMISETARSLKDGGTIVMNMGNTRDDLGRFRPLDTVFFNEFLEAGLTPVSRIAWTRGHGLFPKRRLAERYEVALVLYKGAEQAVFHPGAGRRPQKYPDKKAFRGPNKGELSGCYLGSFPTDVWDDLTPVKANHPEYDGRHPCPFPVAFAKRAIGLYSQVGALICDPYEGSGSTRVAAIETGRKFIGCDLFYDDLRRERAAKAQPDTVTPLPGVTERAMELWRARQHPTAA